MKLYFIIAFFSIAIYSNSQEVDSLKRFFVEIGGGISIPKGNFANAEINNLENGFAKKGFNIYGNYNYIKNKIGFNIGTIINIFSVNELIDTTFTSNFEIPSYLKYDVAYGKWFNINIFLGPSFCHSYKNTLFKISLLGGFVIANRPFISHNFYSGINNDVIWQLYIGQGKGFALSVNPEISITYDIFKRVSVKTFLSYTYSNPNINFKEQYEVYNSVWVTSEHETKIKISSVNIGLCLVLKK